MDERLHPRIISAIRGPDLDMSEAKRVIVGPIRTYVQDELGYNLRGNGTLVYRWAEASEIRGAIREIRLMLAPAVPTIAIAVMHWIGHCELAAGRITEAMLETADREEWLMLEKACGQIYCAALNVSLWEQGTKIPLAAMLIRLDGALNKAGSLLYAFHHIQEDFEQL